LFIIIQSYLLFFFFVPLLPDGAAGRSSVSSPPPTVAYSPASSTISASMAGVIVFIPPSPEPESDLPPKPTALSFIGVGLKFVVVVAFVVVVPLLPEPPPIISIVGMVLRMYSVVAVVTKLFTTQYMPNAAGTFSANHPTMNGNTLSMTLACCCCGSSLFGCMRFIDIT